MTRTIQPAPVRKSIKVKASQQRAFTVFTADFSRWWPSTHHIGAAPMKRAVLEPEPGGRWYEIGEDGSECQWGRVLAWEPPARLLLAWQIRNNQYEPDLVTEVEVQFHAESDGYTRVELEHRHLERFGERAAKAREMFDSPNGWGKVLALFGEACAV